MLFPRDTFHFQRDHLPSPSGNSLTYRLHLDRRKITPRHQRSTALEYPPVFTLFQKWSVYSPCPSERNINPQLTIPFHIPLITIPSLPSHPPTYLPSADLYDTHSPTSPAQPPRQAGASPPPPQWLVLLVPMLFGSSLLTYTYILSLVIQADLLPSFLALPSSTTPPATSIQSQFLLSNGLVAAPPPPPNQTPPVRPVRADRATRC